MLLRRNAARATAVAVAFALLALARLPELPEAERAALAARYAFARLPLHEVDGVPYQQRRVVNPAFEGHVQWTSGLGAAVALADLDGDGLPNDVCHVDPRTDLVTIAPAPGTADRYAIFVLDAAPLPYDRATMAPTGCVPADLDEDGRLDLLVYYWGRTPVLFFQRAPADGGGLGRARFVARELVASGERWYTMAATFADLDGDGHVDLVVGNYFADGARVLDANAAVADSMHHSWSRAYNGGRDRVFRWTAAGARADAPIEYREVAGVFDERLARQWTLGLGAADLDGDLLPELYVANDFGPDRLLHNRSEPGRIRLAVVEGRKTLTVPGSKVLGRDSFKGMGIDFADLNDDGRLDMFVSNIAAEWALQESNFVWVSTAEAAALGQDVAPYVDRSEELGLSRSGWGWDTRFGDFDNDGTLEALQGTGWFKGDTDRWPELQELATANDQVIALAGAWPRFRPGDDVSGHDHDRFWVRAADGRYYDLGAAVGLAAPQMTRGIATADVDGDGDLDFAVANQWEQSALYRNDAPRPGAFLGLHLLTSTRVPGSDAVASRPGHPSADGLAGRVAVGASATVRTRAGRRLTAQVDGGNGHSGKRSSDLHFGLGGSSPAETVSVDLGWRDAGGVPRRATIELQPGWHTVLLGGAVAP